MGCFSFLCKVCGKGIRSTSFSGEHCKLFLLRDGEVLQMMEGQYDSYGTVFIEGTQDPTVKHKLMESQSWNDPTPDIPLDSYWASGDKSHGIWLRVCDLMHDANPRNGIAAVHTKCFKGNIPTTQSDSDPNQGWGNPDDGEEDLMGVTDSDYIFDEELGDPDFEYGEPE